jgi:hypothetical protein
MRLADLFSRRKATRELRAPGVEFLGEQDGANERSLKESFRFYFVSKTLLRLRIGRGLVTRSLK